MSSSRLPPVTVGGAHFRWGERTYVMGVINVTSDSFSGDGLVRVGETPAHQGPAHQGQAARLAVQMVEDGADLLDVGGESTRPGFEAVDPEVELARVLPVVERLRREVDVPLSIDTGKTEVARAALAAGATILNDIDGLRNDPGLASAAAASGAIVIAMHNQRGRPHEDVIGDIRHGLEASLLIAEDAGLPRDRVWLDPGFGFGWSMEQNLELLRRLAELRDLGCTVLIGTSRKSTIGQVLDLPVDQRLEGTAATVAIAIANGADIVRVHDVRAMARVARMTDAVVRG